MGRSRSLVDRRAYDSQSVAAVLTAIQSLGRGELWRAVVLRRSSLIHRIHVA
jgi:hypothetical protein